MLSQTEALIIPHILREPNSIIVLLFFEIFYKLSVNASFVSKKTQVANNGTALNCSKFLISQSDYGKIFLKHLSDYDERSINNGQSIYDELSHVAYLFSIYDEISHNVVYLFSTPNLGNHQANMTIPPTTLNQSKLLKYFQ